MPLAPQRCSFPVAFALSPPACVLCRRAHADPNICGPKLRNGGICAHRFCLCFANGKQQQETADEFHLKDISCVIKRAAYKDCFICGESGATITCWQKGCKRRFHLPCAVEGRCITQFFEHYRSFCWEHRPQQAVVVAPENTACLICLELVEGRTSYRTLVCPACKHAWFHRACVQNYALHAGFVCFSCPHCQNQYQFLTEMRTMGIRIPRRGPSWTEDGGYAQLRKRHSRCDARQCLCPGGREEAEQEGPWQLLLCCSCAAEGTHKRCSSLKHSTTSWECDTCAGAGTSSGASSALAKRGPPARQCRGCLTSPQHLGPAAPALAARHHWDQATLPPCKRAAAAPAPQDLTDGKTKPD
ncbi:PHD finger protein 7-like [Strigops habroptila]|uniref:PHD finger protein 7-like n=1 Tax=Strigops habroptila TaxID=2489341 RepID=UPI0011CFF409|nr:PHD finger protein 7-like [Strigops habroptila]